jgi:hypothetical protein
MAVATLGGAGLVSTIFVLGATFQRLYAEVA